ncbi:hypothetical protein MTR_6g046670 [Medicago truncatula]|uniref:RNase H type-1 domain-containing protein n=1 Tax=Medicago truncatula TaxID=3880 RepID=G7KKL3_MEDTR|nr:hypothetical protein MTR_6g046670 [Medicago truncatula]
MVVCRIASVSWTKVWNRTGLWGSVQHVLSNKASTTIWKHRNLRVWDDVTKKSATVIERAKNMVGDWQLANAPYVLAYVSTHQPTITIDMGASTSHQHNRIRWQPPMLGRHKCNIDAAFSSYLNCTGNGICVRDSEGTFVLAKTITYPCTVSVDVGEALVLHSALQWLSDMHFGNVDCRERKWKQRGKGLERRGT